VVAKAIGDHQAVAIGQGADGGQVGLEATRKQQHPFPVEPASQLLFQGTVQGAAARHQP
jgi:hypothetical protein